MCAEQLNGFETAGPLSGKGFTLSVQGCRTNLYEAEAIAAALEGAGAHRCDSSPDIAVVVTCTITGAAEAKCRKLIRRMRRKHPEAVVAACGCYVQTLTLRRMRELGLDIAVGNRLKYRLKDVLSSYEGEPVLLKNGDIASDGSWDSLELDRPRLHTRAFLKVQDGCNHYCSYCIVPYVRGAPVSRDVESATAEARRIAESGCAEIVLTGIHLGLYERLPELVGRLSSVRGLKRLRFGSIEPFAVTDELLDALADSGIFCPHLHMPLQSGDAGVLAAMRRGYSPPEFASVAERARRALGEDLHISTDLMVAFPSESRAAFKRSLSFVRDIGFGKVHVFPYSARKGTAAAEMEQVEPSEASERTAEALALASELHERYCSGWIGREVSILAEETDGDSVTGLSRHYVRISGRASGCRAGFECGVTPRFYRDETLFDSEPM
jgi:threonylcarbamoyladenosine tRNA methylthiotransferase MtaB